MINKDKVYSHFNRHSDTYDTYAIVQKDVVHKTLTLLNKPSYNSVFEFGSGTGELTRFIIDKSENLVCLDLSDKMNSVAQEKLKTNKVKWHENDIEYWRFVDKYDLIISSSTFQWVENKRDVLVRIINALNEEGEAVISFFDDRTFSDFRDIYMNVTGSYYKGEPQLISKEDIEKLVYNLPVKIEVQHDEMIQPIEGLRSFFQSLKKIGANNPNISRKLSRSEWKQIFDQYDKINCVNDKPFIRYGITYLKLVK